MFSERLFETALTNEKVNPIFDQKISISGFADDTILATARALLYSRIPEGELLDINRHNFGKYNEENVMGEKECGYILDLVVSNYHTCNAMHIFVANGDGDCSQFFEYVSNNLPTPTNDFEEIKKVHDFFQKAFDVRCFVDKKHKTTFLFTDRMTTSRYHYLQCGLLAFFPWYFDTAKDTISDIEKELIMSLRETTSASYIDCLNKIAESMNLQNRILHKLLDGFESFYAKNELSSLRTQYSVINREIASLNSQISDYLKRKQTVQASMLGLSEMLLKENTNELANYFELNKNIHLEKCENGKITFVVTGILSVWDEDQAEAAIDNEDSVFYYEDYSYEWDDSSIDALMRAIFVEEKIKLRVCAAFELDVCGEVEAQAGYEFSSDYADYYPNPHLNVYACLGTYREQINRFIQSNNIIGAIDQCMASCQSLNVGDLPVMERFVEEVLHDCGNVFELPDGKLVNAVNALEYLKGDDNNG